MKIKRILAGLMSFAMIMTALPIITPLTASAADNYIFNIDFSSENTNTAKFKVVDSTGRWSGGTIVDGKMVYTRDEDSEALSVTSLAVNDAGNNSTGVKATSFNQNGVFELGYTVDFNKTKIITSSLMAFQLRATGGINKITIGGISQNASGAITVWNELLDHNVSEIDGGIKVTIRTDLGVNSSYTATGILTVEYEVDGEPVVYGPVTKTYGSKSSAGNLAMLVSFTESKNSSGGAGTITLDDIYMKEVALGTVTFDLNGADGDNIETTSDMSGSVTMPDEPTRDGYAFDGWFTDEGEEFTGTGVEADMTVYAKWTKLYTVKYDTLVEGIEVDDSVAREDTNEIVGDLPAPTRNRYQFDGWYKTYDGTDFSDEFDGTGVTADMTVYAKWLTGKEITFKAEDADDIKEFKAYPAVTLNESEIPTPERLGYRFDGWYLLDSEGEETDELVTTSTIIEEGMVAVARWTRKHVVTLESFGGEIDYDTIYTLVPIDVADLPVPTKVGNTFIAWYTDSSFTNEFDGTVTEDVTLYAKYTNVLFTEDFEYDSEEELNAANEALMKQLLPDSWSAAIKSGAGIVEDADGNHSFRLPGSSAHAVMSFESGGPGLYEVSFRMRQVGYAANNIDLVKPYASGTTTATRFWMRKQYFQSGTTADTRIDAWAGGAASDNWVNVTVWYDTENGLMYAFLDWEDTYGNSLTQNLQKKTFTLNADYIDGIGFGGDNFTEITDIYLDDYVVTKVEQPKVERVTVDGAELTNGMYDVSLNPTIEVEFSEAMLGTSISTSSIYLTDESGTLLTGQSVKARKEDDKTIVTVNLANALVKDSKYKLCITTDVTASAGNNYYLDNAYEYEFTTVPNKFQVEAELYAADGVTEITKISTKRSSSEGANVAIPGDKVIISLKLRNYAGDSSENYFVSAALVDTATQTQYAYSSAGGTISTTEGMKDVLVKEITLPESTSGTFAIKYFLLDDFDTMNCIWDVITLP